MKLLEMVVVILFRNVQTKNQKKVAKHWSLLKTKVRAVKMVICLNEPLLKQKK